MRLLFSLSILTLHHTGLYPDSPTSLGSSSESYIPSSNKTYNSSDCLRVDALRKITLSTDEFSGALIQQIGKTNSDNFVISPLAALLTLTMAYYGAEGHTKNVFSVATAMPKPECFWKTGLQALIDNLANHKETGLNVVNGIFVSPKIQLRPEYTEIITTTFRGSVSKVDFENTIGTSNWINQWCSNKTNSLINNVLTSTNLTSDTSLVFVSTASFKGKWSKKFDIADTTNSLFYDNFRLESKSLPTMSTKGNFHYGELTNINATFVEIPYKSKQGAPRMSMFIILPEDKKDPTFFLEYLEYITVKDLIDSGNNTLVHIQVPRFTIENEIDLKSVIEKLVNPDSLFEPVKGNFKTISESADLFVGNFKQKAVISIDEESGEDATTPTTDDIPDPSSPAPILFSANRTFFFMIYTMDKNPQNIFTGRFSG